VVDLFFITASAIHPLSGKLVGSISASGWPSFIVSHKITIGHKRSSLTGLSQQYAGWLTCPSGLAEPAVQRARIIDNATKIIGLSRFARVTSVDDGDSNETHVPRRPPDFFPRPLSTMSPPPPPLPLCSLRRYSPCNDETVARARVRPRPSDRAEGRVLP